MKDKVKTRLYEQETVTEVLALAQKHNANFILIDDQYEINIDLD